jgi:predicted MFS family arabinose efflux permease
MRLRRINLTRRYRSYGDLNSSCAASSGEFKVKKSHRIEKIAMEKANGSKYGWFIIILGGFTNLVTVGIPVMCMPVLFHEISKELDLSLVQIGAAWGMGGLASMVMSPFGGLLGDRFGTKHILVVSCIFSGIAGAMRGLSTSFTGLALTMFLFGIVQNTIVLNIHKCAGVWFSGKKMVLANGIVSTGIALGMLLGAMISDTIMSPLLGGWRNVLFLYGAGTIVMGLLWGLTRREPVQYKENQAISSPPFRQALSQVLRIKDVWLFGLAHFCYIGSHMGFLGYLPLYLRGIGWAPASADGALASLNGAGMLGAIPLSILAGRLGLRKSIIMLVLFISLMSVALLPLFHGFMVWPLVLLCGFVRDGYFAVLMTMVIESRGIGAIYAGTAMGIIFSFGNLGTFIASPLGNRLAVIHPGFSFIFWAALVGASLLIYRFSQETKRTRIGK